MTEHVEPELDTDDQRQAAAAAVQGLSADSKQELVGSLVQSLGGEQQKQAAAAATNGLPADSPRKIKKTWLRPFSELPIGRLGKGYGTS